MNNEYQIMKNKIDSLKTPNGGWTKESLKSLGVGWPPPKGWRKRLLESTINKTNTV